MYYLSFSNHKSTYSFSFDFQIYYLFSKVKILFENSFFFLILIPLYILTHFRSSISLLSMRFTIDHDQVATLYEKAGNLYKSEKKPKNAMKCYELSGKHHQKAGNLFHAGKAYENSAVISVELGDISKAVQDYKTGAESLLEDGKVDRAAELLVKSAKAIERDIVKINSKNGDKSSTKSKISLSEENKNLISSLYNEALRMYAAGDKFHMSTNTFRAYNAFLLKQGMYDQCLKNIENQNEAYIALKQFHNIWKNHLSSVVIQLHSNGDTIAASEIHESNMSKYPEYASTKECELASQLIQAFERNDPEQLSAILTDLDFKYLEAQVSKIALKLTISPNTVKVKKTVTKRTQEENELFGTSEEENNNQEEQEEEYVEEPDAFDPNNLC